MENRPLTFNYTKIYNVIIIIIIIVTIIIIKTIIIINNLRVRVTLNSKADKQTYGPHFWIKLEFGVFLS